VRWIERLKEAAGWDLFLQVLALLVLLALGAFAISTERCQDEASASTRVERADGTPAIQIEGGEE